MLRRRATAHPAGSPAAAVRERFDLPRRAFDDVIDGVAMDLDTSRYETFDDLFEYCRRVASAVGLICIKIFGCRSEQAREYAINLGLALQLTNILRDVSDDSRGRLYLPLEDLRACGCTVEALAAGVMTDPVRRLMEFECRRAREFYRRRPLRCRPKIAAAGGGRNHAGGLLRNAQSHRAERLRRLHRARPGAAGDPGDHRAEAVCVVARASRMNPEWHLELDSVSVVG